MFCEIKMKCFIYIIKYDKMTIAMIISCDTIVHIIYNAERELRLMKKKYLAVILAACMAFSMTACGKGDNSQSEENGEKQSASADDKSSDDKSSDGDDAKSTVKPAQPTVALNYNLSDYVKLGDYSKIEYKAYLTDVSDKEIMDELEADISSNNLCEEVDRKVKEGDYVVISFEGTMNGKTNDNLKGTSQTLKIGSDSYIPGFEDGLIGHKKGDKVTLDLTFPKDYSATDYAGKPVTFKVTIEAVKQMPEITDKFIKKNFGPDSTLASAYGWSTLDEAKKSLKSSIESTKKSDAENYKLQDVMDALLEKCTFKDLPEDFVEEYYNSNIDYYQNYADYYSKMYGSEMTLEDYAAYAFGISLDELKDMCKKYAQESVKQDIALWAIAEKEGIKLTDKDYEEQVNKLFEQYKDKAGYTKSSQFVEANGGEDTVKLRLRVLAARDWVLENAKQTGTYSDRSKKDGKK